NVEPIDPTLITGHTYEIQFDCDYNDPPANTDIIAGSQRYTIVDKTNDAVLVKDSKKWSRDLEEPESPPIIDGLRWGIQMSTDVILIKEDAYWTESSQCTYKLIQASLSPLQSRSDYELLFIGSDAEIVYGDLNFSNEKFNVPFECWNTVTKRKANIVSFGGSAFEPNTKYFVYEKNLPESPENENYQQTFSFTLDWILPDTYDEDDNLIPPDVDWAPGDTLVIPVRKPFERGDGFMVRTDQVFEIVKVNKQNLDSIRVVPNPYIVRAQWESDSYVRKLQFTNLPNDCKIYVFTL
ncbi:MAG: hypothetical protein P8X42_04420, partial [Calditrichaceae bacterium]